MNTKISATNKVSKLQDKPLERSDEDNLEATAIDFATHPDFAQARSDGLLWDSTLLDGLTKQAE